MAAMWRVDGNEGRNGDKETQQRVLSGVLQEKMATEMKSWW